MRKAPCLNADQSNRQRAINHPERVQIDYTAPAPPSQEKRDFLNTESKREELKQIVLSADEQELDRIIKIFEKILEVMQEAKNDQRGI